MVKRILLAEPRGFCAGVERAIAVVEEALRHFGCPVYVRHHIVHNTHVVKELEEKGAVFIEDGEQVPRKSVLILSAHGSSPHVAEEAKKKGIRVIDAVCPLVTKVHLEGARYHREGFSVLLIGHEGHQEVIGTMGRAPMKLVESISDAASVEVTHPGKVAVLTQTTLSVDETRNILEVLKKRFPLLHIPPKEDICYATTNRQQAVKELVKQCDLVLVVGSRDSSNSMRLVETARKASVPAYLIEDHTAIEEGWLAGVETLGITSGASVPERLLTELVAFLQMKYGPLAVETCKSAQENFVFQMPRELKEAITRSPRSSALLKG